MSIIKRFANQTLEDLYNRVTGDEDARVCKDIPEKACNDQPRNFFAYLWANVFGKVADEIASAKLVIPWLFGSLGVPAAFTGFLVPIREAGVLLPQLIVAAAIRHLAIRKYVWLLGSILSSLSLFGMAIAAISLDGYKAGLAIITMLIIFSLSRGLCSVSAKDVLGKTVSKSRRGALMGWSVSLSGFVILGMGIWLSNINLNDSGMTIFAGFLVTGGIFWLIAAIIFALIKEQPGAIDGGGNAISVALKQLSLIKTDEAFRKFLISRALLLSVALAPPFYVLIAQSISGTNLLGLGALIIANGLASSFSAPFWGYMGDKSSRQVMVIATLGTGMLGIFVNIAIILDWNLVLSELGMALMFLVLSVMHSGARLGRKVYLVDMSNADNRAAYVAVSNTVIGVLMILAGGIGLLGDFFGPDSVILILGLVSILAAYFIHSIPDVSLKD
ncbi:MAG: MFS transporter [Gammaproteobacteria bacterium]|nr:MFS transporter [Gammaproteobacteria bacterium]